jgi:hypothetical protein
LFRVNSEAQWLAVTDVTPVHDAAAEATGKAYAAFNGNPAMIRRARTSLRADDALLQATHELAGRAKQRPPDRMGLGGSRCRQCDLISAIDLEVIGSA